MSSANRHAIGLANFLTVTTTVYFFLNIKVAQMFQTPFKQSHGQEVKRNSPPGSYLQQFSSLQLLNQLLLHTLNETGQCILCIVHSDAPTPRTSTATGDKQQSSDTQMGALAAIGNHLEKSP